MRLSTAVALLFPLASYPIAYLAQGQLHPRIATRLMSCVAFALAVAGTFTLAVVAVHAALRLPQIAALTGLSGHTFAARERTTVAASVGAAVVLILSLMLTVVFLARHARRLSRSFEYARSLPGEGPLVVTDDESADAYHVPGSPSRIVVSAGMLALLDGDQQLALVAHEDSHLKNRHYIYASVVRLAAFVNPLVRPFVSAVDFTLERWADEDAARTVGDRFVVATAVSQAALARKHAGAPRAELLVFHVVGALRGRSERPGPVPRRVSALLRPEPSSSWLIVAVTAVVVLAAGAYAIEAGAHLNDLMRLARSSQ